MVIAQKPETQILDSNKRKYTPLESELQQGYHLADDFEALVFDKSLLAQLGIRDVLEKDLESLANGSLKFQGLRSKGNLRAPGHYFVEELINSELEKHNYTGMCPTNVLEVNPSFGSCSLSCLYCLVSDGDQRSPITVFSNYSDIVKQNLEKHKNEEVFFYYSPKIDTFSEPLLETGVAHDILREFGDHYQKFPDSKVRLFIASKAGPKHLKFKNNGDSVLKLLRDLEGKVQFNPSIGFMPSWLHDALEPNVASVDGRIDAVKMLQDNDVYAYSVLMQPIIPYYVDTERLNNFFSKLESAEIMNVKPEFLTTNMENLALIAQYVNQWDKNNLKDFLEPYLATGNETHLKQRCRRAPDKELSKNLMNEIKVSANRHGISTSICNWVRKEINLGSRFDGFSRGHGFRCLGYQDKIFGDKKVSIPEELS